MKCGHTDIIPAPCEFREEGSKNWLGKRHPCSKKTVFRSDFSFDCMECSIRSKTPLIKPDSDISQDIHQNFESPDITTMQVIVRNEGFLRKRGNLRPLSPFVPPSCLFNSPSPQDLQLQFLVNEAFMLKRQSRKALQAHMENSLKQVNSEESYQLYCEVAEWSQEAQSALTDFRGELKVAPNPQPVCSKTIPADLETEYDMTGNLGYEIEKLSESFSRSGGRLIGLVLEGKNGIELITSTESFKLDQGVISLDSIDQATASSIGGKGKSRAANPRVNPGSFENMSQDDVSRNDNQQSRLEQPNPFEDFYFDFQENLRQANFDDGSERPPSRLENRPFDLSLLSDQSFETPRKAPQPPTGPRGLSTDLPLPTLLRYHTQNPHIPLSSRTGLDALQKIRQYLCMTDSTTPSEIVEWVEDNDILETLQERKQRLTAPSPLKGRKGQVYKQVGLVANTDVIAWSCAQEFLETWESLDWEELSHDVTQRAFQEDFEREDDNTSTVLFDGHEDTSKTKPMAANNGGALSRVETPRPCMSENENAAFSDGFVFSEETIKPRVYEHKLPSRLPSSFSHGNSKLRTVVTLSKIDEAFPQAIPQPKAPSLSPELVKSSYEESEYLKTVRSTPLSDVDSATPPTEKTQSRSSDDHAHDPAEKPDNSDLDLNSSAEINAPDTLIPSSTAHSASHTSSPSSKLATSKIPRPRREETPSQQ